MSYYSYHIPRDPIGTTYYSSNYVTPTYFPSRTYSYTVPIRSYNYTLPARSTTYYSPPRTTYYSSYESPRFVPLGRTHTHALPVSSHARVSRHSEPGHSFTKMPILLRDPETIVVLPHHRQLNHVYDAFDDDPIMQLPFRRAGVCYSGYVVPRIPYKSLAGGDAPRYYEDRIKDYSEDSHTVANKRLSDIISLKSAPRRYAPTVDLSYKPKQYRPSSVLDDQRLVRHNIAVRSFFDRNKDAADDSKYIGSGNVSCLNFVGGRITSRRPRSRIYDTDKTKRDIDILSRYGRFRDDTDLHHQQNSSKGGEQIDSSKSNTKPQPSKHERNKETSGENEKDSETKKKEAVLNKKECEACDAGRQPKKTVSASQPENDGDAPN